ncbi:Phosphatidylinositol-3-phosphatase SAC1 [Marasmius sp. AFHP31]|nr:Phosphatidylinositol-3-phosphatase SAC1 [Marasmius sp. AFHP31]
MSPTNGAMEVEKSPTSHRSRNHSTDTLRTRRSNRSSSRDRERRDRHRHERRRSRSRDRYRDRDRTPDRYRDRDQRRRERDSDRHKERRRDRADSRHSHRENDRERDREDRDRDRRRKRADDLEDPEDDRAKRKKVEGTETQDVDVNMSPSHSLKDSPRSRHSDRDRRRRSRPRDPRDEMDDGPRYRDRDRDYRDDRRSFKRRDSPSPPPKRRPSPKYDAPTEDYNPDEPKEDDSEQRSVFVSQLAARMTARDLGYFFEDKLGEGSVMDSRIVTDRISRRSKGIGYVEFKTIELVEKAIALTGTVVMGLPIMVQLTESERNRLHPGDGNLNLPPGVSAAHGSMQLYVGSLHFNLTENDIKQVFEPFGPLEYVDLHRDPMTGRSKGYAFVQYKRADHAKMALEQMEGFELAGRALRVNTVHEKGSVRYTQQDSLDDSGGGNLNAASRQALMQKLARIETPPALPDMIKPNIPTQAMQSRSVLLKNMFDPEEETERDWDKDLAEDVKGECEEKYGKVEAIKIEKETQASCTNSFERLIAHLQNRERFTSSSIRLNPRKKPSKA